MPDITSIENALKSISSIKGSLTELMDNHKKAEIEKMEKKSNTLLIVVACVGAAIALAALIYAIYRYFTPDYLEDYDDDFDDRFEDDFFDDEDTDTSKSNSTIDFKTASEATN